MKPIHALTIFLAGEIMAAPLALPLFRWKGSIPGVGYKASDYTEDSEQSSTFHEKRDMSPAAKGGIIIATAAFMSLLNFVPDIVGKLVGHGPIIGGIEKRNLHHHKEEKRKFCEYQQYYDIDAYGDCIIPDHKNMSDFHDIPGTDLHEKERRNSYTHQEELEDSHESLKTDVHEEKSGDPEDDPMIVDGIYDLHRLTDLLKLGKREMNGRTKTGIILGVVGGLLAFPIIHEIASYAFNVPFVPASPLGFVEGVPAKRDATDGQEDQDKANTEVQQTQTHWNHKRMSWKAQAGIAGGVIGFFLTLGYGADLVGQIFNPFRGAMDVLEVPWGMGKRDLDALDDKCVYHRPSTTEDHSPSLECVKHELEHLSKRGHKTLSTGAIVGLSIAGMVAAWAPLIINRVSMGIGLIDEGLFKRDNNETHPTGNEIELFNRQLVTILNITDRPEAPKAFIQTVVGLGEGLTVEEAQSLWNYTSTLVGKGVRLFQTRQGLQ